jgi:sulfate/thiosulfate transport system ATP-binding protein
MSIEIRNVTKTFGSVGVLQDVSLDIPSGELVALLGPSGCGKTTLLRIIAGLEFADRGSILLEGADASNQSVSDRQVGFVFQHYALFRHMTVFENIAFGLRVKPRKERPNESEIRRRVHELLELVQLDWLADRYPTQLSGGQRQRIALARALAVEPKVLLLDEPFGALDAKVRKDLRRWLRRLHDEIGITSIFVTHDQEEALEVADRVVLMNRGQIEQIGTPEEVYDHPATPFVYGFLGSVNLFHGRVQGDELQVGDHALSLDAHSLDSNTPAVAYARPHDVDVVKLGDGHERGIPATVRRILAIGPLARIELERIDGALPIEAEVSRRRIEELALCEGDRVLVQTRGVRVFADDRAQEPVV